MAKLSFNKLGLKVNSEYKTLNYNSYIIEVKQYLPLSKKLEMIEMIVNHTLDNNVNYFNALYVEAELAISIMNYYTNLNLSEKQKEEPDKIYDLLISNGLYNSIIALIPDEEIAKLKELLFSTLTNIYGFNNSLMGMMQMANDSEKSIQALKDLFTETDFSLVKEVMSRLD